MSHNTPMHISRFSRHALCAALVCAAPAYAAVVGTGTPASCTEAALDAALAGGGSVTFNCGGTATIMLTTTKVLNVATSIDGAGLITLDGDSGVQHFVLNNAVSYTLAGLTLAHGYAAGGVGGSILVNGATLRLNNTTLYYNLVASGGRGGAIYAHGGATLILNSVRALGNQADSGGAIYTNGTDTLALTGFVADNNRSANGGGAILHRGTALSIQQSLFHDNRISALGSNGGAILVNPDTSSSLSITNTTFAANMGASGTEGGALSVTGVTNGSIYYSTFAGHSGTEHTILVRDAGTQVTLRNTLIGAPANGANCATQGQAQIVDGGNNMQFGGSVPLSCGMSIPQADPMLAPLADNGGFSQTMALLPGSPAIDAGSGCVAVDQRGVARPIGPACDIGAYEAPLSVVPPGDQAISVPTLGHAALALLTLLVGGLGLHARRRQGFDRP